MVLGERDAVRIIRGVSAFLVGVESDIEAKRCGCGFCGCGNLGCWRLGRKG